MRICKGESLTLSQKQQIFELWNKEYPRNLKYNSVEELENYLRELMDQNHMLLLDEKDTIKGWYFDFIRENERWFVAIIDLDFQGRTFGTQLMELAKQERSDLSGWVINSDNYQKLNGEKYKSPTGFYKKLGFEILSEIILINDKITATKIRWSRTGYNNG